MPAVVVSLSLATSATSWSTSRKSIRWWMYSRSSTAASAEMLDLSHEGVCMKAKNVFNCASLQWFIIVMHCSGKHKHLSGKYYGCHPTWRKWIHEEVFDPELWAYSLNILCSHPLEILKNPCIQEERSLWVEHLLVVSTISSLVSFIKHVGWHRIYMPERCLCFPE